MNAPMTARMYRLARAFAICSCDQYLFHRAGSFYLTFCSVTCWQSWLILPHILLLYMLAELAHFTSHFAALHAGRAGSFYLTFCCFTCWQSWLILPHILLLYMLAELAHFTHVCSQRKYRFTGAFSSNIYAIMAIKHDFLMH